ncbi:Sugar transferase involved in LPS biosynthesis (colanic, teichoic acid) [Novosphingobium sp. CF614]|uniref:sugar transferase n=1 Tax=Novosphingobium sp. CF614 TaxID=1884364 RepID=UPI0008E6DED7|nr:sugar transferase [Novosphingobium sp. CF614]SFG20752.1 Sugar transferase involved in LPS biosynthesis (colanic, teichoic acid) [Novosphingobium sp. CF614]
MLMRRDPIAWRLGSKAEKLRAQLLLGLFSGVVLPAMLLVPYLGQDSRAGRGVTHSIIAATLAIIVATLSVRRFASFPGTRAFTYILPSFASTYGLALTVLLLARLDYNRLFLSVSFALAVLVAFTIALHIARNAQRHFWLVPFGRTELVRETPEVRWGVLTQPDLPSVSRSVIVADLHHDHDDDWARMLAVAAIQGHEVYHTKVLMESLTGQVSMEHLSENSFGSLVPNLIYVHVKRAVDLIGVLVLAPVLAPLLLGIALMIKLGSPGPVLFIQERMGYRGIPFRMIKFRTMHVRDEASGEAARSEAMTALRDPRITRIGHILRRSRMDELPQIWHILKGEMSWIGPRPEAIPLSRWYENEIPFYLYRHILRPGISGWAQVRQGHVTDVDDVRAKLKYDFYYIKNFSAWLDLLIALKTLRTVLSGFGSR